MYGAPPEGEATDTVRPDGRREDRYSHHGQGMFRAFKCSVPVTADAAIIYRQRQHRRREAKSAGRRPPPRLCRLSICAKSDRQAAGRTSANRRRVDNIQRARARTTTKSHVDSGSTHTIASTHPIIRGQFRSGRRRAPRRRSVVRPVVGTLAGQSVRFPVIAVGSQIRARSRCNRRLRRRPASDDADDVVLQ